MTVLKIIRDFGHVTETCSRSAVMKVSFVRCISTALLLAAAVLAVRGGEVNQDCVNKLTKADPHMSAFVGQT